MNVRFFILVVFLNLISGCAWWKDCETCFVKEKNSKEKSTVFNSKSHIETRPMYLFLQNNRTLRISFLKIDKKNHVKISQSTNDESFKNTFVLGSEIKLGFVFDNGENFVLSFDGAENKTKRGTYNITSNMALIDEEFHNLLKNQSIVSVEIQNPFLNRNSTKVKQWDVETGFQIKKIYDCFLQK
jgi:hypothetical protein